MSAGPSFAADAHIYDRSRRQLVPCFDEFYGAAIAQYELDAAPNEVLDLGAGTGLLTSLLATRYPNAMFTLVDVAPEMLDQARTRLGDDARFSYVIADLASFTPARTHELVVSALAIHHLDAHEKRGLFARLLAALSPGGVFVNADQVLAPTPAPATQYERRWIAASRDLGVSDADLAAAQERMRHDRCDTLDDQLGWLRECGFVDVDCVYKWGFFAVMRGGHP